MPTSVPMMPDAGELHGENLLYIIQGSGTDRDRKVALEKIREFCTAEGVALFEFNTSNATSGVLTLALGASTTSAFVAVSGTGRNPYTLHITGSVPAGCQINVLMLASGTLKLSSDATINGIDSTLSLSLGDSALLGRGTGTVWWGSASRSAANVDAAVLSEQTRAEEEESALSTAITNEAKARGDADTALGERITGITAQAVYLNLADADPTTGVIVLNASAYKCNLHVFVHGAAGATPPVNPGYFAVRVDGALPAGCQLHVSGAIGGSSSYADGDVLPVQVEFTNSYNYGIGAAIYPYPAYIPLLQNGHFSAIVMYDGVTWLGDSTDIVAMAAHKGVGILGSVVDDATSYSTKVTLSYNTSLPIAHNALDAGTWLVRATANFSVANASGTTGYYRAWLRISSDSGTTPDDAGDADTSVQTYMASSGYPVYPSASIAGYKLVVPNRTIFYLKVTPNIDQVTQYAWGRMTSQRIA